MPDPIEEVLVGKTLFSEKMDNIALAIAGISSGTSHEGSWSSYTQLQNLIRMGLGEKILPVETQLETQRETALTISKGDSTGITGATLDEEKFLNIVEEVKEGIFELSFDGAVWHKEDGSNILLAAYGITVTGTPVQGDHIIVQETATKLVWDVLDHNKHTFQNTHLTKGVVIGMHNLFNYGVLPFCPAQLMYYSQNGLPAGKYKFTLVNASYGNTNVYDGTYVFELTQPIPADGGFRHSKVGVYQSSYAKSDVTTGTITTYGANPQRATVESSIAVREYDSSIDGDATDLGTFSAENRTYLTASNNLTRRQGHGNHNWATSVERQWLNSTAKAVKSGDNTFSYWYSPQTNFDMPPSESVRKMAGFLHGFDKGLLDLIQPVAIETANFDGAAATKVVTYDRIWLQSMTEMGLGNNNGIAEGGTFEYWRVHNTQGDRIKYEGTTARYWWLRSPSPSNANYVRIIYTSGELYDRTAIYSSGVVPACVLG